MTRRLTQALALLLVLWGTVASADVGPTARAARARPADSPGVGDARAAGGVVNLNDANVDELARLPGIGPAKAQAIIAHRKGHPFRKLEDLTKVKGIGRKTFGRLRPYLSLIGPTTLKEDVKLRR